MNRSREKGADEPLPLSLHLLVIGFISQYYYYFQISHIKFPRGSRTFAVINHLLQQIQNLRKATKKDC